MMGEGILGASNQGTTPHSQPSAATPFQALMTLQKKKCLAPNANIYSVVLCSVVCFSDTPRDLADLVVLCFLALIIFFFTM